MLLKSYIYFFFMHRGFKLQFWSRRRRADKNTDVEKDTKNTYWPARWRMSRTWLSCTACPVRARCRSGPTSRLQPQLWTPGWGCLEEPIRNREARNSAREAYDSCILEKIYISATNPSVLSLSLSLSLSHTHTHTGAHSHSIKSIQLSS